MISRKLKHLGAIGVLSSALIFSGCTPEEQAFGTGAAVGVATGVILSSYSYPHYYGYPYYYYGGRYYYGGYYRNGYYYYRGRRYYGGHYYYHGYRYYNGRRYRAQPGRYGYYRNKNEYTRYRNRNYNRNRGYNRNSRSNRYGGRHHNTRGSKAAHTPRAANYRRY